MPSTPCSEDDLLPTLAVDAWVELSDVTTGFARQVETLEPFGMGNPMPVFAACDVVVQQACRRGQDGSHLSLTLRSAPGARPISAIWFRHGEPARAPPTRQPRRRRLHRRPELLARPDQCAVGGEGYSGVAGALCFCRTGRTGQTGSDLSDLSKVDHRPSIIDNRPSRIQNPSVNYAYRFTLWQDRLAAGVAGSLGCHRVPQKGHARPW